MINKISLLCLVILFNFTISLVMRVSVKRHFKMFIQNISFILFIAVSNLLFQDVNSSLKVGLRLFLAIDYTYLMGCYFNPTRIRNAFYYLLYPFKSLFDIDSLILVIVISLTLIPVLIEEVRVIKSSLKCKGFDFTFSNLITRPQIYLITFLNSLFDRLDELEKSLIMKAH